MPFTPFHFGPGYLVATVTLRNPSLFSFYIFALSQVVIDCETLWNIAHDNPRLHTFFHTYSGSLIAGAISLLLYRPFFYLLDKPLHLFPNFKLALSQWRIWELEVPTWKTAFISNLIGVWSHVLFDSVDHSDVTPFWPWTTINPFYELVGGATIYLAFSLCGLAALAWSALRKRN
jgi:hypothetical protein